MVDLHRHDEFSLFDGFGKPKQIAKTAKEKGLTSLGIANHGAVNGLVDHYYACKDADIKPILGCEVYYLPVFEQEPKKYHLCLFVKDITGYENLNKILTLASKKYFYYKATVTLDLLRKYHKGLICSSACIGGELSQLVLAGKQKEAQRVIKEFKSIFGDDFYIEIQPYSVPEKGLQEKINIGLIKLAKKCEVKMILTSDSHFADKSDYPTYVKMHEIAKHGEFAKQYKHRYIPTEKEIKARFVKMHGDDFDDAIKLASQMVKNLEEIEQKVDGDVFGKLKESHIVFDESIDANKQLWKNIVKGLKERGKYNEKNISRCKQEYEIIKMHGFADYFLIVQDYVKFAKDNDIYVGPGRGSVCNCQVAYALEITDVDAIYFDLDFTRFLRPDKKKMPDIDLDFETEKRQIVIDYLVKKYKGRAAQICSKGLYKIDNLLNDLFKVCGVEDFTDKQEIKKFVKSFIDEDTKDFLYDEARLNKNFRRLNGFDDILVHFKKMYKKVRYIGTHAAGVAIVGDAIINHTAVEKRGDKFSCVYDLEDLEKINVLKFDMLGLRTLSIIDALEKATGEKFSYDWFEDEQIYEEFRAGNTDGIFQFERQQAKDMLIEIETDCMEDIIAANSMNRPAPLKLGVHEQYAENKKNLGDIKKNKYYKYTKETYGTIVYQEQITRICLEIGKLPWEDIDIIMKAMKGDTEKMRRLREENEERLTKLFVKGASENGIKKSVAREMFKSVMTYSFNKGHATGYSIISFILMWYKVHYSFDFWVTIMKFTEKESDIAKYKANAVRGGNLILLPHVNGFAKFEIAEFDGEPCMQEGLSNIKNVGKKVALAIETERLQNGDYEGYQDLIERVPKRLLNTRVLNALENAGAIQFNQKKYMKAIEKYNIALYGR